MENNENQNLSSIEERLCRLERQNGLYRKLLVFLVIFIFGAGAIAWKASEEEETKKETLALSELNITDKDGKVRIRIAADTLKFFDSKGKTMTIIDSKSLETQYLFVKDEFGVIRSKLFGSRFELLDRDGKLQSMMNGETMEMYNKGKLILNPSVLSFQKYTDKGEIPSVNIYPLVPELTFFDPKGSGRFVVNINAFGIYYYEPVKKSRINLNPAGIDYFDGNANKSKKWP